MKSSKQRRIELKTKKQAKEKAREDKATFEKWEREAARGALVDSSQLAPNNSYDVPDFVRRGYYQDIPFTCLVCGKDEVWTAVQQKWWYEVAKGSVWSTARRCRSCRQSERERRTEARRVYFEGMARKQQRNAQRKAENNETEKSWKQDY